MSIVRIIEPTWWFAFFAAFGLCVGSFLNAVIYRVPRDISLRDPLWSFCPVCNSRIRWYDNLPLLSYILLGGKCRDCRTGIAPRYPTGEALAALMVVILLDCFFVAGMHRGLADDAAGLTWRLSVDWPIFLAHVTLFACLGAMSVLDIENYWVDIRFTMFATVAGFLLHAIWTPAGSHAWDRPSATNAATSLVMTLTVVVTSLVLSRYRNAEPTEIAGTQPTDAPPQAVTAAEGMAQPSAASGEENENGVDGTQPTTEGASEPSACARLVGSSVAVVAGLTLLFTLCLCLLASMGFSKGIPPVVRWGPALVLLFGLIVAGLARHRESDHEIKEAIEAERPEARRVAAAESLVLLPTVLAGVLAWWVFSRSEAATVLAEKWFTGSPWGQWRPFWGVGTAATGFVVGGGIGWAVRILGTMAFGKEALGTGDIHLMAAAGCVAGWPVVAIGFVLCSFLALLGWIISVPFKRAYVIALGPWLTLAFLIVVLFYDPIVQSQAVRNVVYVYHRLPVILFGAPP